MTRTPDAASKSRSLEVLEHELERLSSEIDRCQGNAEKYAQEANQAQANVVYWTEEIRKLAVTRGEIHEAIQRLT